MSVVTGSDRYVSLGMYPFEPLRPAWETLWRAVHERVPTLPGRVRWDVDAAEAWTDPRCAVSQACGWPVATALREGVAVVGAFSLDIGEADGHRYRSVIVSPTPMPLHERELASTTAAATSDDSLSGWISLGVAAGGRGGEWSGEVMWTGSHVESLRLLASRDAEVASIDALTWAYIARLDPSLVDGLCVIGHGPLVPSLPVVVPRWSDHSDLIGLRQAFVAALDDPATQAARETLLLDGFVPLDHHDYSTLLSLGVTR